jgi:hypothetical protein
MSLQFLSLARLVIGEEHEITRVRRKPLAQHHAGRWHVASVDGGQYHGVGIRLDCACTRFAEPRSEQRQRLGRQRFGEQIVKGITVRHVADSKSLQLPRRPVLAGASDTR